jgi:integrase
MSIYRRKSGRWAVLIDEDRGPDKVRQRKTLGTYKTHKEAEQAERGALEARDRGIDLSPRKVTVGELVTRYLDGRETLGRGTKTVEEYRRQARLYIDRHLGSLLLWKLKPAHVTAWVSVLLQRGGKNGKTLSAKSVRHAFALLSSALRWGVSMELVGRNVCEASAAPAPPKSEAKAFSGPEVARLVAAARETRWEHFLTLALTLGARRGELLALHWNDVDLEAGHVTIRASLSQTKGTVALKSTKTGRVRRVPLSAPAQGAFRKQNVLQKADRLRAGARYCVDPLGPVFTDEFGARLSPKAATNAFARLAKTAKVSTTSLHATRHTAATNLIAGGVDVTTAASLLGHVNANVTLSLYSHVVEGADRAAVDVLAERLERSVAEPSA